MSTSQDERAQNEHEQDEMSTQQGKQQDAGNSEDSSSSTQPQPHCANCSTPQSSPEKPLKPCAKCQTTLYCSKDCTKADFKSHKKVCAKLAQEYFSSKDVKMESSRGNVRSHRDRGLQKWQFDT